MIPLRRYEGASEVERIDSLPTIYLECRTLGHAWTIRWWGSIDEMPEDLVPSVARAFRWVRVRVAVCLRCSTIRDEFYPKTLDRNDPDSHRAQVRRYRYPDRYILDGVGTSPTRSLFTRAAYERWMSGERFR